MIFGRILQEGMLRIYISSWNGQPIKNINSGSAEYPGLYKRCKSRIQISSAFICTVFH